MLRQPRLRPPASRKGRSARMAPWLLCMLPVYPVYALVVAHAFCSYSEPLLLLRCCCIQPPLQQQPQPHGVAPLQERQAAANAASPQASAWSEAQEKGALTRVARGEESCGSWCVQDTSHKPVSACLGLLSCSRSLFWLTLDNSQIKDQWNDRRSWISLSLCTRTAHGIAKATEKYQKILFIITMAFLLSKHPQSQ